MLAPPADALLAPLRGIDGLLIACLIDPDRGTVLGSVQARDDLRTPVAAAGAADVVAVLALMSGQLPADGEAEDVIVTFSKQFHLIRVLRSGPAEGMILLVTLDRAHANLAMANRAIRDFTASF